MAKEKRSGGQGFGKPPKLPRIDGSFDFEELTEVDKETNYAHLVFTVPLNADESTEHRKIYILERETTPLTKLISPNS